MEGNLDEAEHLAHKPAINLRSGNNGEKERRSEQNYELP